MIESSRIRRAEHKAHMLYDRLMKKFVQKKSEKNHLGDLMVA